MTRAGNETWPDGTFVQQLPDADRAALFDAGTPLRFEDDEILVVQGDAGDYLYVLTSGLVKVIVGAVSGAQTTLAIRSRGDLVGEFALLDDKPRMATARAAGPVTVLKIGGAAFLAITGRSPRPRRPSPGTCLPRGATPPSAGPPSASGTPGSGSPRSSTSSASSTRSPTPTA
jgi:hypothetical protein